MSMTEHWEWALKKAKGDWLIFLGQDDALQPYFFDLANKLTHVASRKNINSICSKRAYFFWHGCEELYGDIAINYEAQNIIEVKNFIFNSLKALFGFISYFELPQMYTSSIFHKSIINKARDLQFNNVFSCHPQDANLVAIAASLEKKYLYSGIPLGWVGTSPKSAGMAIASVNNTFSNKSMKSLKREYLYKINNSKISYHYLAGDFSFDNDAIYLWQAFLKTEKLRSIAINKFLHSHFFKFLLLSSVYAKMIVSCSLRGKINQFIKIVNINHMPLFFIKIFSLLFVFLYFLFFSFRYIKQIFSTKKKIFFYFTWTDFPNMTIKKISDIVKKNIGGFIYDN